MARPKTPRATPVSQKDAGQKSAAKDDVADLLAGAESPDDIPNEPVEAVAAGAQPMPGSASDREERAEAPKPAETKKDLRRLAPKKDPPRRREAQAPRPGRSALEQVVSRGIDPGDTAAIAPVELFRVVKGGRAMVGGRLCLLKAGGRVTRLTHDLRSLRLQGIDLELIGRS